jgi:hypothetical protein
MKPSSQLKAKLGPKDSAGTWLRNRLNDERLRITAPSAIEDARSIGYALAALDLDVGEQLPAEMIPLLP